MRIISLLLMLSIAQAANGQAKKTPVAKPAAKPVAKASNDPCSVIKKEVSEDKTQSDFSSPADGVNIPIIVKRTINTNPEWAVDNFFVVFQTTTTLESIYNPGKDGGQTEKQEKRVVIEFDDHTTIVDDTIQISHDFTDDKTEAIRNVYFPITDESARSFTTKKITKFNIAGQDRTIPADSAAIYLQYFQCVKSGK